jgi:hypothetical protein
MVSLEIPTDLKLLQAAGRVALAHGQMEHIISLINIQTLSLIRLTPVPLHIGCQEAEKMTESFPLFAAMISAQNGVVSSNRVCF